jgi:hypothetical protein
MCQEIKRLWTTTMRKKTSQALAAMIVSSKGSGREIPARDRH